MCLFPFFVCFFCGKSNGPSSTNSAVNLSVSRQVESDPAHDLAQVVTHHGHLGTRSNRAKRAGDVRSPLMCFMVGPLRQGVSQRGMLDGKPIARYVDGLHQSHESAHPGSVQLSQSFFRSGRASRLDPKFFVDVYSQLLVQDLIGSAQEKRNPGPAWGRPGRGSGRLW